MLDAPPRKPLSELLAALPAEDLLNGASAGSRGTGADATDPLVSGVVQDSRQVRPGYLFVAIRGAETDGHRYIASAIARGTSAVVVEQAEALPAGVPGAVVRDGRAALARLAAALHGYPARQLRVIGITGTDGKTTTASLTLAILAEAGRSAGGITTVAAEIAGRELDTGFHTTTPDSPAIQSYLAQMVEAGARYAVVETTSHGLDQGRVLECEYDVAAVTNVTVEHLDYHKTFEDYLAAKSRLFAMLGTGYRKPGVPKVSILNSDDVSYDVLRRFPAEVRLSYGLDAPADVRAAGVAMVGARAPTFDGAGSRFTAETPMGAIEITMQLPGRYNIANALAATAIAISQGVALADVAKALGSFRGISGRLEEILPEDGGGSSSSHLGAPLFRVFVDFAHTPNSLDNVLTVARRLTTGRVISVFGCAGLRDPHKRPAMGEIAGRLADLIVITAEDPRTEDVGDISQAIAAGCERAGRQAGVDYWCLPDRAEAIDFAVALARPGDLVIVTGKGHERSMCFGTVETPWSDQAAARAALSRRR